MPFPDIDPIAFAIGPVAVRWYALAYLAGVGLGMLYGMALLRKISLWPNNTPPFDAPSLTDFAFWAVIAIVVGGRLGYVAFYNLPYYLENPMMAFAMWEGGMSFHGGLIGLVLAMVLFTRYKKGRVLSGLDLLACVAPIGLFLGRISNFINAELWGRETDLPWGVVFPNGGDVARHPTQLYEAGLEGILLFVLIRYLTHVRYDLRKPGLIAGVLAIGYSLSRMLVELVRVPDPQLGYLFGGWITMGTILSLPMLVIGIGLVIAAQRSVRG